jgi:hypothetical protein
MGIITALPVSLMYKSFYKVSLVKSVPVYPLSEYRRKSWIQN